MYMTFRSVLRFFWSFISLYTLGGGGESLLIYYFYFQCFEHALDPILEQIKRQIDEEKHTLVTRF